MSSTGEENALKLFIFEKLFNTMSDILDELVKFSDIDDDSRSKIAVSLDCMKYVVTSLKPEVNRLKSKPKRRCVAAPVNVVNKSTPKRLESKPHEVNDDLVVAVTPTLVNEEVLGVPPQQVSKEVLQFKPQRRLRLAPRRKTLFVSRLHVETTSEELSDFLFDFLDKKDEIQIFRIKSAKSTYSSFKVSCDDDVFDKLLNIGEPGVLIREYHENTVPRNAMPSKNWTRLHASTKT
ncbi:hypothetical protein ACFFRR_004567 [Megaselia abdita]